MDASLLNPEIQKYINSQLGVDVAKLALQKNPFPDTNWISILNQIAAKTKVKDKLPEHMRPVKETISADAQGCRYLLEKEPRLWAKVSKAFESKQGKVGVKVEAL